MGDWKDEAKWLHRNEPEQPKQARKGYLGATEEEIEEARRLWRERQSRLDKAREAFKR